MEKEKMKELLDNSPMIPHIFCPSWRRPNFVSAQKFKNFSSEAKKRVHIVVRPDQYDMYKEANPELHILPIPEDYPINGLASTRQFIFEYAVEHRYPMVIDMDDDITEVRYLFDAVTKNGDPCSHHSTAQDKTDDPLMEQKVLQLAAQLAKEVFAKYPDVYLGNIRRQRFCQSPDNANLKYIINAGPTPRQVTFMNVKGLYKAHINRDVKRFDRHGDDIGFCAVILAAGGSLFNIPCLCYDYVDEKCDSVIRTPENEKELHAYEYNMLQEYPIRDYLKTTFRDAEGNYMWGDIDYRKLHKLRGTKPEKIFWEE